MPGGQGGTLAAPVWNAYMVPAHGDDCASLPAARDGVPTSSPFFGHYSTTGREYGGDNNYDSRRLPDRRQNGPTTTPQTGQGYEPEPLQRAAPEGAEAHSRADTRAAPPERGPSPATAGPAVAAKATETAQ